VILDPFKQTYKPTKFQKYINHSITFMRNERKFKDVSLIFKNFNSWKILIFVFDAHESKKPISKNQLLQKLKCSYKTGNKYIDELVKKKILISFNKKNLNLKSNFSLRNLDYINQIDKRCNYYIPSLNIINDFKKFLDLKIIHYKKK
jgi:hypothetical protein